MVSKTDHQHQKEMKEWAEFLKSLANPIRLCLLEKLIEDGPSNVSQIGSCMEVSQPNLSQHLRKLRDQGIVKSKRVQNQVFYSCEREDVKEILKILKR